MAKDMRGRDAGKSALPVSITFVPYCPTDPLGHRREQPHPRARVVTRATGAHIAATLYFPSDRGVSDEDRSLLSQTIRDVEQRRLCGS